MLSKQNYLGVFLAHRRNLLRYAQRIIGDHGHAEDVVQDAYLRLMGSATGKLINEPVGYLYRIVRNLAIDGRRRERRGEHHALADMECAASLAADHPSPESAAAANEDIRILAASIAELPERTRIALEMHQFGGCTLKTIAQHLGISVSLTHSLVVDGLEHCRARLLRSSSTRS